MDIKTSLLRSFGDLRDIKKNLFLSNFIGLYLFEDVYTKHDTGGMMVESNIHSNKCRSSLQDISKYFLFKLYLCHLERVSQTNIHSVYNRIECMRADVAVTYLSRNLNFCDIKHD